MKLEKVPVPAVEASVVLYSLEKHVITMSAAAVAALVAT